MSKSNALPVSLPEVVVKEAPRGKRINDLDLKNWKKHDDIVTDSLWIIPERDHTGAHSSHYHGNFVPQIPRQTMQRYTKAGDVVIDGFAGSGTTLIEGRRLGRHVLGVDLNEKVAAESKARAEQEANPSDVFTTVVQGDSRSARTRIRLFTHLRELGKSRAQMVVLHPPYHDIIHFSQDKEDLSNAASLNEFVDMFGEVVGSLDQLLEANRYLILVIGDKYAGGEWIPLGFHTMQAVLKHGYTLKSLVVKNMTGNRAKRNLDHLWRFRALNGGFYIFKHEYVMVFKKGKDKKGSPEIETA